MCFYLPRHICHTIVYILPPIFAVACTLYPHSVSSVVKLILCGRDFTLLLLVTLQLFRLPFTFSLLVLSFLLRPLILMSPSVSFPMSSLTVCLSLSLSPILLPSRLLSSPHKHSHHPRDWACLLCLFHISALCSCDGNLSFKYLFLPSSLLLSSAPASFFFRHRRNSALFPSLKS